MANNIAIGPNAMVATQTIAFASVSPAITISNISIIYKVADPLQSYVPGRSINAITGFEEGIGYYINAVAAMDLEDYLIPPIPEGGTQTPAAPTAGVVDDEADTFNWTNNPLFPDLSDYEFTVNAGSSYAVVTAKPIVVGDVDEAVGQVGVRVKAAGGNNPSATLYNATEFTTSGGYDADAQAFFDASGQTDTPTKDKYNTLVLALKAAGSAWTKAIKIHGMKGPNLAAQAFNLKDPLAFEYTYFGTPVYNVLGLDFDGVDDYADPNFIPEIDLPSGDSVCEVCSIATEPSDGLCAFGVNGNDGDTEFFPQEVSGNMITRMNDAVDSSVANATAVGLYLFNRQGSTEYKRYKDGILIDTPAITTSALTGYKEYDGALSTTNTPQLFFDGIINFRATFNGLTDGEAGAVNTAIATFLA